MKKIFLLNHCRQNTQEGEENFAYSNTISQLMKATQLSISLIDILMGINLNIENRCMSVFFILFLCAHFECFIIYMCMCVRMENKCLILLIQLSVFQSFRRTFSSLLILV